MGGIHVAAYISDLAVLFTLLAVVSRQFRVNLAALLAVAILLVLLTAARQGFDGWPTVLLVLVVKTIALPGAIVWTNRRVRGDLEREPGSRWSFLLVVAVLVAVAHLDPLGVTFLSGSAHHLVTSGLILCLAGILSVVTHRHLLNQVIGLGLAENGLFLVAMGLTNGLPPVLDGALLLDLVLALVLLLWLSGHVRLSHGHLDVDHMDQLRG